jgi:hypothetical protein
MKNTLNKLYNDANTLCNSSENEVYEGTLDPSCERSKREIALKISNVIIIFNYF